MVKKGNKIRTIIIIVAALIAAIMWVAVLILRPEAATPSYGEIRVVETPDRTESTEHPLFVKVVYEPVIPDGTNIASIAKIEANGYNDVYVPRKVKDGRTTGVSYWEGASDAYPNILTATFPEEHTIHAIKVCLCPQSVWGARTQTFSVEISEDGDNFQELIPSKDYEFNPDTNNEVVLELDTVSCKAVQLVFTGNTGASGAQVAELELYSEDEITGDDAVEDETAEDE